MEPEHAAVQGARVEQGTLGTDTTRSITLQGFLILPSRLYRARVFHDILENTEVLRLKLNEELPDLIDEERAAVGKFETPCLFCPRS